MVREAQPSVIRLSSSRDVRSSLGVFSKDDIRIMFV